MAIKTILTCDTKDCGKTITLDGPYHIAKTEMKEKGFRNVQNAAGEWKIECPECKGKK